MRLFSRMHASSKLPLPRPEAIYLDAAHEQGETLIELQTAWELLASGGLLMGDDWAWAGVRHDVLAFAKQHDADDNAAAQQHAKTFLAHASGGGLNCTAVRPASLLLLCNPGGTWAMFKPGRLSH
jgi:hypothetical protein